MKLLGRILFFRAGLRELIGKEIERGQKKQAADAFEERLRALEAAWRTDHAAPVAALVSQLETAFPDSSLAGHLQQVLARSPLQSDPYPHLVIDDVVPEPLHRELYEARPAAPFWRDGREGRRNWTIGDDLASVRTEAAWRFMNDVVVPRVLTPALTRLFHDYLGSQAATPHQDPPRYERSGGRLMLRRPGYQFEPHLDPYRALLTGLFYFGAPTDSREHGTKLFRSDRTVPEGHHGVYYPLREGATCELVKVVPSRPNSMLVFASRIGLHGADIPANARPKSLERYAYQFYIGIPKSR